MAKLRGGKNELLITCVEMLKGGLLYSESDPEIFIDHVRVCIACLQKEILKFKTKNEQTT